MNYLAHLYFSDPTPYGWAGSLMGDFVKGAGPTQLPNDLQIHLKLHRYIDRLTQNNAVFQMSRKRLNPRYRYARSILVDVFYDHFLACNWNEFSAQPLEEFAQSVYNGLEMCFDLLGPDLQQQLPHIIKNNWLVSYQNPDIIQRVLLRIEERLQHKIALAEGFEDLFLYRDQLEDDFRIFMAEAAVAVAAWKQNQRRE